jgi:hypothetical protein
MLILIAFSVSNPVNAALVNWLPHETKCHWYIRDIYRPGLVRPLDRHSAQQVLKHFVPVCRFGGIWPAIHGLDRHPSHHRHDLAPPHGDALAAQQVTQHPATGER